MWLELAIGVGPIVCAWAGSLIYLKRNPDIEKRLNRFLRAEIESRLPIRRKRPTLEIALHTQAEVDVKWWDQEFAKLERAIPDSGWARMVEKQVEAASKSIANVAAPTAEEINRWSDAGIKSITTGDLTFNVQHLAKIQREREVNIAREIAKSEEKLKAELVNFERAKHELAMRDVRNADATPPGLPHSLREAQDAKVSLQAAKTRTIAAFQGAPGARAIPRPLSVRIRSRIENAATWNGLVQATCWGNLILAKHGAADECEFCEYQEVHTYANPHVKRYKISECWGCAHEAAETPVVEPVGLWTPAHDSMWSIS